LKQFLKAIDNFSEISKIFDLDKKKTGSISINSGVLFFNNQAYSESNFYEKTVEIFKKSKESGFPRKGDDSLLCLTMAVHSDLEYTVLPVSWNDYRFYTNLRSDHRKSTIIHNASQKPWNPIQKTHLRNPYVQAFVSQWRKIRKKMEDDGRL
jgi:lipopolysaccharide biosynthesis glycosyltransferase